MLKRRIGNQIWLISQPDHAAVSGYLAAHWGNETFTQPGYYESFQRSQELRAETILGIAEHDNGWWEWEADPEVDSEDGLPLHLTDLSQEEGFERWRLGVPRFEKTHPYAALLISLHAYWLHAYRVESDLDPDFLHPLFGLPNAWPTPEGEELRQAKLFVSEQKAVQDRLISRMQKESTWSSVAVEPQHLYPHARLLQLADALSLYLCFGAKGEQEFEGIPRNGWEDRTILGLTPGADRRITVEPYPFDEDPLPVVLRARIIDALPPSGEPFHPWWQSLPRKHVQFEFRSSL